MFQPLYDFLISHGVTNLIDVDGLVYAPVEDILPLLIKYGFVAVLFALLLVVAVCALCRSLNCDRTVL